MGKIGNTIGSRIGDKDWLFAGGIGGLLGGTSGGGAALTVDLLSSSVAPGFTFTRSTIKSLNVNGVLTDFAINTPAVNEDGTWIEESRTNSIRNGECQGATVGVIGSGGALPTNFSSVNTVGLTQEIIGSGTISGFKYVDIKLSGTPSAGTYSLLFDGASQISAAAAQVWTASAYYALVAGALTGVTSLAQRVSERLAGVETAGTSQTFTPTIDSTRISTQRTLTDGTTTHVISQLDIVVTAVPIDLTLRISSCQIEQGGGATTYIRTTSAAVTRGADLYFLPTANFTQYNQPAGTFIVKGRTAKFFNSGTSQTMFNYTRTSNTHSISCIKSGSSTRMNYRVVVASGLPVDLIYGSTDAVDIDMIIACAYSVNNCGFSRNGASELTDTTCPTMPSGMDNLYIGSSASGGWWNGPIRSLEYYTTRLS